MKKYERIYGTCMLYAIFGISLLFGTVLDFLFSKFSKKGPFSKSEYYKIIFIIYLVSLDLTKKE